MRHHHSVLGVLLSKVQHTPVLGGQNEIEKLAETQEQRSDSLADRGNDQHK